MTARDFCAADKAVAVEQCKKGCIVRWDFERIMNKAAEPSADLRNRRRGRSAPPDDAATQGVEQESGFVAFSVRSYGDIPAADSVIADIEADLSARYADTNRPAIDLDGYRNAIENLHNLQNAG